MIANRALGQDKAGMKAIVILGAAVWQDGPSPTLRRRCLHGARLFHDGQGDVVLPCGGPGRYPPAEALLMADLLRDAGVPAEAIHPEARSTNTAQNLALCPAHSGRAGR